MSGLDCVRAILTVSTLYIRRTDFEGQLSTLFIAEGEQQQAPGILSAHSCPGWRIFIVSVYQEHYSVSSYRLSLYVQCTYSTVCVSIIQYPVTVCPCTVYSKCIHYSESSHRVSLYSVQCTVCVSIIQYLVTVCPCMYSTMYIQYSMCSHYSVSSYRVSLYSVQ